MAEPVRHRGARPSGLAYRMLGDVDGQAAAAVRRRSRLRRSPARTSSTFTAAASISSSPTTRTRSRNPAAPSAPPRMANVWMHNGFLQVEGEKMSKSLGNFVTIHELLRTTRFGGRKWSGEVLRLAMLRTHYRQPIDWTVKALEEAESTLDRWYDAVGDVEPGGEIAPGVEEALCDDLNTPAALAELHRLAHPGRGGSAEAGLTEAGQHWAPELLKASANLLGLLRQTKSQRLSLGPERGRGRSRMGGENHRRPRGGASRQELERIGQTARPARQSRRRPQGLQGRHDMGVQAMSAIALRPYLPADAGRCAEIFRASIEETGERGLQRRSVRGLGGQGRRPGGLRRATRARR